MHAMTILTIYYENEVLTIGCLLNIDEVRTFKHLIIRDDSQVAMVCDENFPCSQWQLRCL